MRGRRFWKATQAAYELTPGETELLVELCRTLDEMEALQAVLATAGPITTGANGELRAHPALAELRGARLIVSRLLSQLGLPDDAGQPAPSATTRRAQRAANVRWLHVAQRKGGYGSTS